MNAAPSSQKPENHSGYYLSVVLGLLLSGWIASVFSTVLSQFTSLQSVEMWRANMAGGIFLGFIAANPVGAAIAKASITRVMVQFSLGFAAGVIVQNYVFVPIAGIAMSNYLFLLVAALAIPLSWATDIISSRLKGMGFAPRKWFVDCVLVALRQSDRLLFVLLMGLSFYLFWSFAVPLVLVLLVIGVVMAGLMVHVSNREADCDFSDHPDDIAHQTWLEMDPDDTIETPFDFSKGRLKTISLTLLPGAVLFGGMLRLAVDFLMLVYPNLHIDFDQPAIAIQNTGMAVASGLAVVFFGMMAVLGICVLILRMIGILNHWSSGRFKENYMLLIRLMYFRPIGDNAT